MCVFPTKWRKLRGSCWIGDSSNLSRTLVNQRSVLIKALLTGQEIDLMPRSPSASYLKVISNKIR